MINKVGKGNITATIIADSITDKGERITTFELIYHRFVHVELMTHRVFSRNSFSSRAYPVKKMIELLYENTAVPIHFGKNKSGMQTHIEHNQIIKYKNKFYTPVDLWLLARDSAVEFANAYADSDYHKQIVNRLLEPFQMIKVIVTATTFENWFNLRFESFEDYQAQHEIHELSKLMYELYTTNEPKLIGEGDWHLPYFEDGQYFKNHKYDVSLEDAIKISCSCCAQVSYRKLDDTLEKAINIYNKLVLSEPVHASAFEHCATPITNPKNQLGITHQDMYGNFYSGNLKGYIQYRQLIPNNVCEKFVLK